MKGSRALTYLLDCGRDGVQAGRVCAWSGLPEWVCRWSGLPLAQRACCGVQGHRGGMNGRRRSGVILNLKESRLEWRVDVTMGTVSE